MIPKTKACNKSTARKLHPRTPLLKRLLTFGPRACLVPKNVPDCNVLSKGSRLQELQAHASTKSHCFRHSSQWMVPWHKHRMQLLEASPSTMLGQGHCPPYHPGSQSHSPTCASWIVRVASFSAARGSRRRTSHPKGSTRGKHQHCTLHARLGFLRRCRLHGRCKSLHPLPQLRA